MGNIERLIRRISLDNNAKTAVSTIHSETLKLLIKKIENSLAKNLTESADNLRFKAYSIAIFES